MQTIKLNNENKFNIKNFQKSLWVYIIPNSSSNKFIGIKKYQNYMALKIEIAALNENNEANIELINFLAKHLKINKHSLKISIGAKNHLKLIKIYHENEQKICEIASYIQKIIEKFNK